MLKTNKQTKKQKKTLLLAKILAKILKISLNSKIVIIDANENNWIEISDVCWHYLHFRCTLSLQTTNLYWKNYSGLNFPDYMTLLECSLWHFIHISTEHTTGNSIKKRWFGAEIWKCNKFNQIWFMYSQLNAQNRQLDIPHS